MASRYFWNSGNDIGRYNAVYPNGDGKRDIPDYSEMLPNWVWRYYQESGDVELLEEAYPAIQNTADYVLRHIPEDGPTAGLVTRLSGGSGQYLNGIVDWPAPGRFGYDMSAAARTTINALAVEVLRVAGDMAEELGRPAAEVEADMVRRQARIAARCKHDAAPAEPFQLPKRCFFERYQLIACSQCRFEPSADAFVEYRIDAAVGKRRHAARLTRPANELQLAAPGFDVGE